MLKNTNTILYESINGCTRISTVDLARKGYGDILQMALEKYKITPITIGEAIRFGHLDLAYELITKGYEYDNSVLAEAASSNDFDFFRFLFLRDNSVTIDDYVCEHAIVGGNFDIITFVLTYIPKIPKKIHCYAVASGNLDILKYICEKYKDEWSVDACKDMIFEGRLDMLQWAIENNYPCDINRCINIAIENNKLDIIIWFYEKDYLNNTQLNKIKQKWPEHF